MERDSSTTSARWKSNASTDDLVASSNNSSTGSSDILVASGPPGMPLPPLQPTQGYLQHPTTTTSTSMAPVRTTASYINNKTLRVQFSGHAVQEKFRAIIRSPPNPQLLPSPSISAQAEYDSDHENENGDENGSSALDPLKTYSKQETLNHPGVEFVHRGQGRYRMVAAIKNSSPATSQRPTRYRSLSCQTNCARD